MIRAKRGVVIAAALLLAVIGLAAPGSRPIETAAAAQDKPNIVVFYLDDTNPTDGRLWSDPALTPTLYDLFVAHGVHFPNAIGETPLCCPARATLLTGLHTHNHGVKVNDARLFNPGEHIGREMQLSGYDTYLVGKYLNDPQLLSPAQWQAHSANWTQMDVFRSPSTQSPEKYYKNYTLFTKQGDVAYGDYHSTRMIAERSIAHYRESAPETPIFSLLTIYNTHSPNIPMPEFVGDPRCASMPPWNPPNYNEADVSDKPGYVRNLKSLPYPGGWPMVNLCEQMLGVDWLAKQITDELVAEGRFDNTMFVFTADNGMAWGQHRLAQVKQVPYATPVPLYFSWPAQWGAGPRTIDEYTSNIDLAPTFCAYGGCTLGPYPTGQTQPDGLSLKPLLESNGNPPSLGRDALLETNYESRTWAAVRTTDDSELGLWHYIENSNGFKELYNVDPDDDPFELQNVANDPSLADIRAALADRLVELLAEGRPAGGAASIKIIQDTNPNGLQDFAFTGDLGSFSLDDDADVVLQRQKTVAGLAVGSYVVTQSPVPGWNLDAIACPPGSTVDVASGTATIHVASGDAAVCTFKNSRRRPDAAIALDALGPFKGGNVYSTSPLKKQTQRRDAVVAGETYDFWLTFQNDGSLADSFTVLGVATGTTAMQVSYFVGDVDVTADVVAGTYAINNLAPGATSGMVARVAVAADAPTAIKLKVIVSQTSVGDPSRIDVVRAVTTR